MWKTLALVACSASVIAVPVALASEGNSTPKVPTTPTTATQPVVPACDPATVEQALALSRWRERRPLAGINTACVPRAHLTKLHERWRRWSYYRHLATEPGCSSGGKWLRYTVIPAAVVERESGCSWTSVNSSSGACGPYQLLGWTSCATGSWADKMRHHRMALYVLREQGPGAWTAW